MHQQKLMSQNKKKLTHILTLLNSQIQLVPFQTLLRHQNALQMLHLNLTFLKLKFAQISSKDACLRTVLHMLFHTLKSAGTVILSGHEDCLTF